MAFNIDKIITRPQDDAHGRRFGCHLMTDGMSVSIAVIKPKVPSDGINKYGFDSQGTYHPLDILPNDRVSGDGSGEKGSICWCSRRREARDHQLQYQGM